MRNQPDQPIEELPADRSAAALAAQAEHDEQIKAWGKQSYREEIRRAKRMTGPEKVVASLRLFDEASRRVLVGIRAQFPNLSEQEARQLRDKRFELLKRIESKK